MLMSLSACVEREKIVFDTKCSTIVENNPNDEQVDKLLNGSEKDRGFLQRVLANDKVLYDDCPRKVE